MEFVQEIEGVLRGVVNDQTKDTFVLNSFTLCSSAPLLEVWLLAQIIPWVNPIMSTPQPVNVPSPMKCCLCGFENDNDEKLRPNRIFVYTVQGPVCGPCVNILVARAKSEKPYGKPTGS